MIRAALLIQALVSGGLGPADPEAPAPLDAGTTLPAPLAKSHGAASAAAVVIGLSGPAVVEPQGEPSRELRLGDLLEEGERVMPEDGVTVVLLYRDGSSEAITAESWIEGASEETAPHFARTRDLLARYAQRAPAEPLPGSAEADLPRPVRPANGIPVRLLTPTLSWQRDPAAEHYRITLTQIGGEARVLDVAGDSTAVIPPEWALTPGEAYEWTVASLPFGTPSPRVRFRALDRAGLDRVAEGLSALREAGLDPELNGALPAIALFQELDLIYDALALLERLLGSEERPVNPALSVLRSHLRLAVQPIPVVRDQNRNDQAAQRGG